MKNDQSSSRTTASSTLQTCVGLVPMRQTVTALFVASLLTGCASMSLPDGMKSLSGKIKNLPETMKLDIPGNTDEFKNRLYAGAGAGSSYLSPNTRGEGFSVDSSGDMGTQLRLGYDVHNMLAVEIDTSVLGSTGLRPNNPDSTASAEVRYSSAAMSALVYGWSGVQMRSRREGLSAYGRVGFASLKKSSNVVELDESGVVPIFGIGAEYGFSNGLGVRGEVTRFDSDATFVGFSAVYRFGISPAGIGRMIASAAEPALKGRDSKVAARGGAEQETIVERYAGPGARPGNGSAPHLHYTSEAEQDAKFVGSMSERWRPAMRSDDRDFDGVLDNSDSCADTAKHVTVDRYGCGLFDAVLHEVTFKSGSYWLTPRARAQLDLLAQTLLAFPESRIQTRAHTDSLGPADANLGLSSRRAEVVVKYLQSKGVDELQLQAVGMGEAQPLDTNKTAKGRKRNRRVDIVTLPDQDAGQLLVAANVESNVVMTVQSSKDKPAPARGMMVGNNDWNSRATGAKRSTQGTGILSASVNEPGLMAANPVQEALSVMTRANPHQGARPDLLVVTQAPQNSPALLAANPVSDTMAGYAASRARSVARKPGESMTPSPAPLPQPGFAPNFPFSGVLLGVNFARGETTLATQSESALEPLLEALKREPSVNIAIMAHTDNQGGIEINKALSEKRAEAVVRHLVDGGIDARRLKAEGYGELLPLVQNVTVADRMRNRRVEVRVVAAGN